MNHAGYGLFNPPPSKLDRVWPYFGLEWRSEEVKLVSSIVLTCLTVRPFSSFQRNSSETAQRIFAKFKGEMCICISDSFFPWELCPFELRNTYRWISFVSATPMNVTKLCVNVHIHRIFPRGYAAFELRNWPKLIILINQFVSTTPLKSSTEFRENLMLQRRYCVNAQIHRKFWFDLFLREHGTLAIAYNFVQFVWNGFRT